MDPSDFSSISYTGIVFERKVIEQLQTNCQDARENDLASVKEIVLRDGNETRTATFDDFFAIFH